MWFIGSYSFYVYDYFYYLVGSGNGLISWGEYYGGYGFSFFFYKFRSFFYVLVTNSLKIFLLSFFVWFFIMFCLYSLCLERNIEDINEILLFINNL